MIDQPIDRRRWLAAAASLPFTIRSLSAADAKKEAETAKAEAETLKTLDEIGRVQ